MNITIRKKIMKVSWLHKFCVYLVEKENQRFYNRINKENHFDKKIESLKDSKKGRRCFIVGNGPSLNINDLEMIKNEDSFAANLIFRVFNKTEWRPTYYVLQDRYADTKNELDDMDVQYMFISEYYWRKRGVKNPNAICIRAKRNDTLNKIEFSEDVASYIINMPTITYTMIQIAIYMGYSQIYLLGMDHSYSLTYDSLGNVVNDKSVKSHFFNDSNPEEVIANIEGMNRAYLAARNYAYYHNISIVNVTRGGKLEWFDRKKLEEVL